MTGEPLQQIAARQRGLFTRAQASACGMSAYQIRRRIAAGIWQPVLGPVLAQAGLPVTARLRDRAAQLAMPGAILAGPSAARWHAIPVKDETCYLSVGANCSARALEARLLRGPLSERDILFVDDTLVTTRERTVFDCLHLLPEQQAVDLLDSALLRRWITMDDLVHRLQANTCKHGAPQVRRLVAIASSGARSGAERVAVGLLRRAGITGWVANARIHDARGPIGDGDLVFAEARVVVELDGRAFHVTPYRFQHDRERQNRLVAAGWTVLRFTWHDLTHRPTQVIHTIRAIVSRPHPSDPRFPRQREA